MQDSVSSNAPSVPEIIEMETDEVLQQVQRLDHLISSIQKEKWVDAGMGILWNSYIKMILMHIQIDLFLCFPQNLEFRTKVLRNSPFFHSHPCTCFYHSLVCMTQASMQHSYYENAYAECITYAQLHVKLLVLCLLIRWDEFSQGSISHLVLYIVYKNFSLGI